MHEACKAKGVLELHLLQKEAAQLKTQYQSNVPPDEMNVRQIQHCQFHVNPIKNGGIENNSISMYQVGVKPPSYPGVGGGDGGYYGGKAGDLSTFVGLFKNELVKSDALRDYKLEQLQQQTQLQKPPLQQQLMQHRLLQQKRQILQKQVAMETGLTRRQMLRQQSYKIAQQQQILPPLPLNESESEDLLAFQAIVEGPHATGPMSNGSPKLMKTSHIQQQQQHLNHQQSTVGIDCWNTLPVSMQTCQIGDNSLSHDTWTTHPSLYQVFNNNQ